MMGGKVLEFFPERKEMHRGPSFFSRHAPHSDLRIRRGLFALLSLLTSLRNKAFVISYLVVYQWCEAAFPRGAKG